MTVTYRGYEIDVRREMSLGGDPNIYYSVMRLSDGWFCLDSFYTGGETVRQFIAQLKTRINNELAEENPWAEHALL